MASLEIKDNADPKRRLLERCGELDFKVLSREVEPFLFVPEDAKKVLGFYQYIEGIEL